MLLKGGFAIVAMLTASSMGRSQNNGNTKAVNFISGTNNRDAKIATFYQAQFPSPSTDYRNKIIGFIAAERRCKTEHANYFQKNSFPLLIAHRGGAADFPENTLLAIEGALTHYADGIWLTVQLSSDGIPVLYRPTDLSTLTNQSGPVSGKTATALAQVNAGWYFKKDDTYPYRTQPVGIPTLEQALDKIPLNIPVILDMKALPVETQVKAVAHVLETKKAWSRVFIYSTEARYQQEFKTHYPQARLFESRDMTRDRILQVSLTGKCQTPPEGTYAGFELFRDLTISEKFTLGKGTSIARKVPMWTPASIDCFHRGNKVTVVAFGVNNKEDYLKAEALNADAVLVDSPRKMHEIQFKEVKSRHQRLKTCANKNTLGTIRNADRGK